MDIANGAAGTARSSVEKSESTVASGRTKIDRYQWDDVTAPGELAWIDKDQIGVDDAYQRRANNAKAVQVAKSFSWPAFGVVLVARRKDGTLWAVDAQHRLLAARKRSDVHKVPCIIFNSTGAREEASTFLVTNGTRAAVSAIDKFRAQLTAKDPAAILVDQLITDAGRRPGSNSPTTVACLRLLCEWATRDPVTLQRAWPALVEVCKGHPMHQIVVDGLLFIETHLATGDSISEPRFRKRLRIVGAPELLESAYKASAYYARGGAKVWADGMLQRLNRSVRPEYQFQLRDGGKG